MNAVIPPMAEISLRARHVLIQELGVTDAMRFLNQFQVGSGDYTVDREPLFKGETVRSVAAAIRAQRESRA